MNREQLLAFRKWLNSLGSYKARQNAIDKALLQGKDFTAEEIYEAQVDAFLEWSDFVTGADEDRATVVS